MLVVSRCTHVLMCTTTILTVRNCNKLLQYRKVQKMYNKCAKIISLLKVVYLGLYIYIGKATYI